MNRTCQKLTKNITKGFIFTTLDFENMMMIMKIFTVQILCILLLIKLADILKKKMEYLIFDDSADERKKLIKKYAEVWDGLKNEVKAINGGELQKRLHKK